jgi:hypothetical protein
VKTIKYKERLMKIPEAGKTFHVHVLAELIF